MKPCSKMRSSSCPRPSRYGVVFSVQALIRLPPLPGAAGLTGGSVEGWSQRLNDRGSLVDVKDVFGSRSPLVRALHIPFFSHSRRAWINTLLARQAVTPFECETVSRFETERLKHGLCERLDFVRVLKLHQAIACRGCLQSPTCARTHTRHTHTHTHIERTVLTYTCWGERESPCQVTTACLAHATQP